MNVTEIRRPADMERITTPELAKAFIDEQVKLIKEQVGDKKVLLALSGGVDSSVVAALLIKAIGQQLVCVHVNHGLLRKGEPEEVIEVFRNQMNANLVYVDLFTWMRQIVSLKNWQESKILRQREKSSVENSSKYLLKKQESLKELNSWHRAQSGRISLNQKKESRLIIMPADFRRIWLLSS